METGSQSPVFLDDRAEYMGTAKLRFLTIGELERLDHAIAIMPTLGRSQNAQKPLALLIPYSQYMAFQRLYLAALGLAEDVEVTGLCVQPR